FSHVTCTTGQRFPEKEVSKLARDKGIWFALDGAQAPVCVPFDIVDIGVDFYTCSTHKWLMGPKRTGFLYVRQGLLDTLRPLTVGASSSASYDIKKNELVLHPTVQRFEYGTQNDALFYALGKAVDFCEMIGLERIWRHNRALAERFYGGLQAIPGVE
ncbi:MAG: aminotransferase class V-fold PLP-dependent enzyme, partial [Candidatus Aminicenantes bacterium]|nr:aminotransferase class V-fold PLP-dependent enzyme [Candidatus Aminicenantes bacterium]